MHYARATSPAHLAPLFLWKLSDRRHVLDARAAEGKAGAGPLQHQLMTARSMSKPTYCRQRTQATLARASCRPQGGARAAAHVR